MISKHPWMLIVIGFVLILFGFLAPLMMSIRVIEPSFFLSFLSFTASVCGLFLGLIGAAMYVRSNRRE